MTQNAASPDTNAARTLVHYDVRDGVAYLTLDDPPANTYTYEMMRAARRGASSRRASTRTCTSSC